MSIDKIMNKLLDIFDFFNQKNNSEEIKINNKFIYNDKSNTLKVIIPPRGEGHLFVTDYLIKRLNKNKYSCLSYYFEGELLIQDTQQTLENFKKINNTIRKDIDEIKEKYKFEKIDIIAPSLGVVSACMIANNNEYINNLYLLVPGSCLASSLWEGIRTKDLRKNYQKEGIGENKLQEVWAIVAPKNNIDALNGKNIFIAISKSDEIIPYKFGKEFANLVKNKYLQNTIINENKYLGHYFTVLKYYLFSDELIK